MADLSKEIAEVLEEKRIRDGLLIEWCEPIHRREVAVTPPAEDAVLTMDEHLAAAQRRIAALKDG
jgi:hypothetical protein